MIKVVVYDCDGVLVDSSKVILSYYNSMMMKCGLPEIDWAEEQLRVQAMSLADRDILEVLSKGDRALYQKMLDVTKNEPGAMTFDDMSMEPNLLEGLNSLKDVGVSMAIVTNRGKSLSSLLKHYNIEDYFKMLVTAYDVTHPKPSPEGLMKVCGAFEILPDEAVYIGDSPTDYEAAKACGVNFIAYKKHLGAAPIMFDHKDIKKFANILI